ncbi:hypothetical protein LZD49_01535 [Dyadobacter sp. CY261]|uniref:hypothetical protein n=1 Tax=Dyadobacter sp. CY261 TaxID=2907203 RepID=UPI001F2489FD|nr:hypothetical protein [Dyadobacter sp. CY261]MCF0069133.1 hypothetical protein [Dyadobacter sp. CY261]
MEIITIFEVVPDSLYSVQFEGEETHEFSRVFRLWKDAVYLQPFFETHYEDLLAFWEYMSVEEAMNITRNEASSLSNAILTVADKGVRGSFDNLSGMFKPLYPGACNINSFEKSKARGFRRRSWLRVYAVRLGVNKFVVTGGAIKLTRTMNERMHLTKELKKLEEVSQFLKKDQKDEFGLFELF